MRRMTLDELRQDAAAFDQVVAQTPDIDRFCSSSAWVLSAYEAFSPEYRTWIGASSSGYVTLVESHHERLGRFRQPMEASWCLACPFASTDPAALAREFVRAQLAESDEWELLFLSGLVRDSALYRQLVDGFGAYYFVGVGPGVSRYIASLDGGLEGFYSRRASKFRANLRRIGRRAEESGVEVEYRRDFDPATDWPAVYERILAVESRSWKGMSGTGIIDGPMQAFYRAMLPRLMRQRTLRVMFLRLDGEDIGFVFGAVFEGTYRGLQLSYTQDHRELSPGNLAQLYLIERLCDEGVARYDLGSELEYKRGWAEDRMETVPLVVRRW